MESHRSFRYDLVIFCWCLGLVLVIPPGLSRLEAAFLDTGEIKMFVKDCFLCFKLWYGCYGRKGTWEFSRVSHVQRLMQSLILRSHRGNGFWLEWTKINVSFISRVGIQLYACECNCVLRVDWSLCITMFRFALANMFSFCSGLALILWFKFLPECFLWDLAGWWCGIVETSI